MTVVSAASKTRPKIDWRAEAFNTAFGRVESEWTAWYLWERVFTPAERQYLGDRLPKASKDCHGVTGMWMRLHGVSQRRALVEVAVRCNLLDATTGEWLLREYGESPDEAHEVIEWAVADDGLVLVEEPRQVYWRGAKIEINWSGPPRFWDFMWTLARRSKVGGAIDARAVGLEGSADPHPLKKLKHRVTKLLASANGLAETIESVGGAYRLAIPAQEIRIFEIGVGEMLREWIP
jgi:hypothetical protein